MEKLKAHYPLLKIRQLIKAGNYRITASARKTAFEDFDLTEGGIIRAVLSLTISDLYKSMTTLHDQALWQDVYHKRIINKMAYIKLQIFEDDSIVISFKER